MVEESKKVSNINLDEILPNRFQPRIVFDEETINDLADSIKEHGVIQPIIVRPIADKYEIIAGERRYKASLLAGRTDIPAIILATNDKESAEIALIENVQRKDLTPIEEAISYKKILDMGYLNEKELATKLGKSQPAVANKLRLLNLEEDTQEALLNGEISERHARSLLKLSGKSQVAMLHRIVNERLTVRRTDEEIKKASANQTPLNVKEEEIIMNNNPNNIPDVPIVDDNNPSTNPGFMDINNIENNAQDINPSRPAPSMDNLMKPADVTPAPEPVIKEEPSITNGKFFDFIESPTTSNVDTINHQIFDEPIKTNTPETINFDSLDDEPVVVQPKEDVETIDLNDNPDPKPVVPDYSFEDETPEVPSTPAMVVPNTKEAIEAVRECAKVLETKGFKVDLDEYDLGDMYQVIFKITK